MAWLQKTVSASEATVEDTVQMIIWELGEMCDIFCVLCVQSHELTSFDLIVGYPWGNNR